MELDSDLQGIVNLMRRHIEIRNRSWMKRVHRDCFIGAEAVDFLVTQGFADTRKAAVEMGLKMNARKLLRNVTDSRKFSDSMHFYRFADDDVDSAVLSSNRAGNSAGVSFGHGGCKWSFAPHTAHNSYVLDIALAEEIERAVAGPSIEARKMAIDKLRNRIREQAEPDAPNWELSQSTTVNGQQISVYIRKRPRGEWQNMRLNGVVAESPIGFVKSLLSFDKRRQWEATFEDAVLVDAIDIGEGRSALLEEEDEMASSAAAGTQPSPSSKSQKLNIKAATSGMLSAIKNTFTGGKDSNKEQNDADAHQAISLPDSVRNKHKPQAPLARATDDVYAFLETVDMAGIPHGMAIAFLNDPDRQHALAHLRKQMMLSNPQECMLCQTPFEDATDIRFCPCCAMVSCAGCVSKRVFEVVSRNVMNVCVHCYRESSRIFHPPQAVQDNTNIDQSLRGKWWRPEELGLTDYSTAASSSPAVAAAMSGKPAGDKVAQDTPSLYNDQDMLVLTAGIVPLIPGLLDDLPRDTALPTQSVCVAPEGIASIAEGADAALTEENAQAAAEVAAAAESGKDNKDSINPKLARCKNCGLMISRDMEAIEAHMEECLNTLAPPSHRTASVAAGGGINGTRASTVMDGNATGQTYTINDCNNVSIFHGNHKQFAGIARKPDLAKKHLTRIIYRTARSNNDDPREVCAFQDAFVDPDGSAFLYEISVRHSEVAGLPNFVTVDVMLALHVARPIKGNKTAAQISVIKQVDTRSKGGFWSLPLSLMGFGAGSDSSATRDMAGLRKEDLVRELQSCRDLPNLLNGQGEEYEEGGASLDDFELLAVLGRGGFGKVMQVRHKTSNRIYAMKILKKSELRRRRQVERTQTERTILANVRHPFIVCLHYAFQNAQKLYMVMDFVQGGDFFTFMRKFRRLPEDWVRLYILQVAMALQHLHDREIVYRDLKPENILLCADGYLKLTDFGLSRYFETRPPNPEDIVEGEKEDVITRSFCGTEQYMSPEMLLQQGHNYRMDWWCLGLLMHEMIAGKHPFLGNTHYDTLRNMVTKAPNIDSRLSPAATAVVKSLLMKNPRSRLGGKEGLAELRQVQWFAAINWDDLLTQKIEMPYKPKLSDDVDISSFETTFTKEKPVDSIPDVAKNVRDGDKKKGGLFSSMFGRNAAKGNADDASDSDAFKGFSFAKNEDADTFGEKKTGEEAAEETNRM